MATLKWFLFASILLLAFPALLARADEVSNLRLEVQSLHLEVQGDSIQITQLSNRIAHLEAESTRNEGGAMILFIIGVFCALWAQNTGRNPWLWFFLGSLLNVVTLNVLLYKNAGDIRRARANRIRQQEIAR